MDSELKELLEKILKNIPNETDMSNMESTLYDVERALEKQNDLLERIADILDRIEDNLPTENSVDTDRIETLLDRANDKADRLIDKMEDVNSTLTEIRYNTENQKLRTTLYLQMAD